MKIKNSTITFWFQKQNSPKVYVDKLNSILKEHFFEFNILAVPANIDPVIPRLTAVSNSDHSNIQISLINAKLLTNFDDHYSENIDLCIDYLKNRALKLYEALMSCNINIVYSAIFINLEERDDYAVEKIRTHFLKMDENKKINEIGIRLTDIVDDKFYRIVSFNNSKQVKIEKVFKGDNDEIIFPLISLNDASEIENYLNVSLEFNDRLLFNLDSNYSTNEDELVKLFDLITEQLRKEMKRFR